MPWRLATGSYSMGLYGNVRTVEFYAIRAALLAVFLCRLKTQISVCLPSFQFSLNRVHEKLNQFVSVFGRPAAMADDACLCPVTQAHNLDKILLRGGGAKILPFSPGHQLFDAFGFFSSPQTTMSQ